MPYLTGRAIDAVARRRTATASSSCCAALIVVAGVVKGVLMLFRRRCLAGRLSLAVEYDLRNAMYAPPAAALVRLLRHATRPAS